MTDLSLEIGPTDVSYLMGRPGESAFRLIDCREQDEWAICHLPGAVLVPMSRIDEVRPRVDAAAHALGVDEAVLAKPLRHTLAAHAMMAVNDEVLLLIGEDQRRQFVDP